MHYVKNLIKPKKILIVFNLFLFNISFSLLPQYKVISSELKTKDQIINPALLEEFKNRKNTNFDSYILGPEDTIKIKFEGFSILDRVETIKIDGTIELPRIGTNYVSGLTLKELKLFLEIEYARYVIDPSVSIKVLKYRPVRVFVGGEVVRPGYYSLSGIDLMQSVSKEAEIKILGVGEKNRLSNFDMSNGEGPDNLYSKSNSSIFPTVFDAIRTASGITTKADLSKINLVRSQSISEGGGQKMTTLSFIPLLTNGDLSQNIRLSDGDRIYIPKSEILLKDQILKAGQTNLSPKFISVFLSGNVKNAGSLRVPNGSLLSQALVLADPKILRGKIEFIRFTNEGKLDRRLLSYTKSNKPSEENPILMSGDIINFNDSLISKTLGAVDEITSPFLGLYGFTQLFGIDLFD